MNTKEHGVKKYCLFYASDFHLEMILLPYIKNNTDKDKVMIFTEKNLSDSIKILLDRTNFKLEDKKAMLNLNWHCENEKNISKCNLEDYTIIINGSDEYISKINKEINNLNVNKINIVDCYNINAKNQNIPAIQEQYDGILNTKKYKKI